MSHAETLPRAANAACAITSSLVFAVPLLAWASVLSPEGVSRTQSGDEEDEAEPAG
jgi:hypothetical protein